MRTDAARDVTARLGDDIQLIDGTASFFGIASSGPWQIRGNGCLAASHDTVVFERWLPREIVAIPRARIVSVGLTNSFLGKTRFRNLLEIRFRDRAGAIDAVAWQVDDPFPWIAALAPATATASR